MSVALIDMNLLFGEVPLFLDLEPAFNWGEVVKNIVRLDSTYLMSILTKHPSGLYVLPSPTGLDSCDAATPDVIEKILRMMQREFDYIIIDGGQSIDHLSLKILEMSDTVLIVSILSLPCLINVKRLIDTFWRLGVQDEKFKIIINRYNKSSSITLNEAEKGLQKKIFWSIPNDYNATISAINQGKTLSVIAQKSEITKSLRDMTSKLIIKKNAPVEKRGFFGLRLSESKA
jgi:pilus assembly protein CpaE